MIRFQCHDEAGSLGCQNTQPEQHLDLFRRFCSRKTVVTNRHADRPRYTRATVDRILCCTDTTSAYRIIIITHRHPFNGPFSGTTQVSRYQKGKTDLDFTEASDSGWQWHQLGRMQVCIPSLIPVWHPWLCSQLVQIISVISSLPCQMCN